MNWTLGYIQNFDRYRIEQLFGKMTPNEEAAIASIVDIIAYQDSRDNVTEEIKNKAVVRLLSLVESIEKRQH